MWSLWHGDDAYVGDVRRSLRETLRWKHFLCFIRTSAAMESVGPEHVDIAAIKKMTKPPRGEHPITYGVMAAKIFGGILATETVLTQRSHIHDDPNMARCKLCGKSDETNYHMLCECTDAAVVTARREWLQCVHDHLNTAITTLVPESLPIVRALQEVWQLDDEGRLITWTGGIDLIAAVLLQPDYTEHAADEAIAWSKRLETACHKVDTLLHNQGGVDKVAQGCFTRDWRRLLEQEVGMAPGAAMAFLRSLGKLMRKGTTAVWRARCDAKAKLDTVVKNTHRTRLAVVIDKLRKKEAAAGRTLPDGLIQYVHRLSTAEQKRWMKSVQHNKRSTTCPWGEKTPMELQQEAATRAAVRRRYEEEARIMENTNPAEDLNSCNDSDSTPARCPSPSPSPSPAIFTPPASPSQTAQIAPFQIRRPPPSHLPDDDTNYCTPTSTPTQTPSTTTTRTPPPRPAPTTPIARPDTPQHNNPFDEHTPTRTPRLYTSSTTPPSAHLALTATPPRPTTTTKTPAVPTTA